MLECLVILLSYHLQLCSYLCARLIWGAFPSAIFTSDVDQTMAVQYPTRVGKNVLFTMIAYIRVRRVYAGFMSADVRFCWPWALGAICPWARQGAIRPWALPGGAGNTPKMFQPL